MSHRGRGFTILELAVVMVVLGVVVAILVLMLAGNRRQVRGMQGNTQVRGIQQSMVMYAQSNGQRFPGFDAAGNLVDATVEYRYAVLLDAKMFDGEYMVSPSDAKTKWTTGPVTSDNYSYAMLDIDAPGDRANEWKETLNGDAAIMSDRNTGPDAQSHVSSVHTPLAGGEWRGDIAWNDNHVTFGSTTHLVNTRYAAGPLNKADNLFEDAGVTSGDTSGGSDAYMIYSGR